MRKILVTGGTGFIGSHTCVVLLSLGYEIIMLDSFINSSSIVLSNIKLLLTKYYPKTNANLKFIECDIKNFEVLEDLFKKESKGGSPIEGVMHFAGLKSIRESTQFPLKYWENNVTGTINLLKVMSKHNCKTIIFSSSASVYGNSDRNLIDENSQISPMSPYAQTKSVVENLLKSIFESSYGEWRIANLRYFNPIGAHPSGIIGEDPIGIPNNVFPKLVKVAANQISKLQIFGNNWETPDGTCIRDYIHIMDLAEGHISALEYLFNKDSEFININLGTGNGFSVLELIETFSQVNDLLIPYEYVSRREGDVKSLIADNTLALKILNWSPKRNLKDMCKDGWNHHNTLN
tara:strand:+ start:961 stop:2004 length:1044 start_codon:yes stop_codon:yes gene_type:complete